jgi:hypothetical protein
MESVQPEALTGLDDRWPDVISWEYRIRCGKYYIG